MSWLIYSINEKKNGVDVCGTWNINIQQRDT